MSQEATVKEHHEVFSLQKRNIDSLKTRHFAAQQLHHSSVNDLSLNKEEFTSVKPTLSCVLLPFKEQTLHYWEAIKKTAEA